MASLSNFQPGEVQLEELHPPLTITACKLVKDIEMPHSKMDTSI